VTVAERYLDEPVGEHEVHRHLVRRSLRRGRTAVQRYEIVELARYGRAMVIDDRVQSTEHDEATYHEALARPALALAARAERVLCLGGANGGLLHRVLATPGVAAVTQIDVDRELFEISTAALPHMHREAYRDPRCTLRFGEPRALVAELDTRFDVVLADLPDATPGTHAPKLFTAEFYAAVRGVMRDGAVFATQAGAAHPLDADFFASVLRTLRAVFRFAQPYAISVPSYGIPWGFAMASDDRDVGRWEDEEATRRLAGLSAGVYDPETHRHAFSLPRPLRTALAGRGRIITDARLLHEGGGSSG
jgi:spermidine synthase